MSSALVLLLLVNLCAATEYYVKPTILRETSCPRESCYTLDELAAKYFYASATDALTDNVTVILLNGTHELKGPVFVKEVNDFTLLGAGGIHWESHVEINCKGVSSLVFDGVINLTITRITFSQCGTPYQHKFDLPVDEPFINALTFSYVFNLRLTWVVLQNSTSTAILAENVLGASVIDHSVFQSYNFNDLGIQSDDRNVDIYLIRHDNCNQIPQTCSNNTKSLLNSVNSHKLHIHNSVLRDGKDVSMRFALYHNGYNLDLVNITVLNGGGTGIDITLAVKNTATLPQITIHNCIIMNVSGKLLQYGLSISGTYATSPRISVVLRNISIENNRLEGIKLDKVKEVELIDCRFVGNQGTPIVLHDSTINVSGTLSFVNNTAFRGGAMVFYGESYMSVSLEKNTRMLFTNNYAEHVGGAIFAQDLHKVCFLQLASHNSKCSDLKNNHQLSFVFTNNTAHNGGDAIYGGSLQYCTAGKCKHGNHDSIPIVGAYIFIVNYWNLVQYDTGHHSNLSLISSKPSRVCLCEDGQPDCLTVFANEAHYPGETFTISAVVVGQGFGAADGTVYAQFTNKDILRLEELQTSQQVKHNSCSKLKYTIFSASKKEMMALSTRTTLKSSENDKTIVEFFTEKYKFHNQYRYDVDKVGEACFYANQLLVFELFINITLLPCPLGFMLSDQPAKCVCHTTLQQHNITCNIDDQTVHREGTVWVNASFAGNESNGVVVHHHCPYGYCNLEELDIRLDFPDTQCNFNHSGILCGGCRPGLSLTLGTSQCLRCSNKYIALLIPFAIAGIVLVAFIKLLNLTVSEGTLNGLIFYANIIGANQATFFPSTSTHCPVLTVFIAWLNLDLGIETCFIDGLNGYWKTWLQFVFPAYIWIITAGIIVVAHYSSTGARVFGNNSVQVLATLFLLSYTKLLRTIITVISFTFLDYPDHLRMTVWQYDGNISYLSPAHTPLFLVALTVFILLWLPYTVVLLLVQYLRKKTHLRVLCWFTKLKPLFDAYLGPFKDKHCYWVGVLLLVRAVLLIISAVNPNNAPKVNLLAIGGTTLVLQAYIATAGKVYRKKYVSFLENLFLLNLGALAIGTLYTGVNGQGHTAVVHTLVGITFLQFIGIIIFHGFCSIKETRIWRHFRARLTLGRCTDHEEDRNLDYQPFEAAQAQPVRLRMIFNKLNEPGIENADDSM